MVAELGGEVDLGSSASLAEVQMVQSMFPMELFRCLFAGLKEVTVFI